MSRGHPVLALSHQVLQLWELLSLNHRIRITEWPGLRRTTMITWFQPPCYVQGRQPPDQAAQSHIQPGLECFQGWGIHSLLGQPVPVCHHPLKASCVCASAHHVHLRYIHVLQQFWKSRRCFHYCPKHQFLLPAPCASSGQRCRYWHWLKMRKARWLASQPRSIPHGRLLFSTPSLQLCFHQSAKKFLKVNNSFLYWDRDGMLKKGIIIISFDIAQSGAHWHNKIQAFPDVGVHPCSQFPLWPLILHLTLRFGKSKQGLTLLAIWAWPTRHWFLAAALSEGGFPAGFTSLTNPADKLFLNNEF